MDSRRRAKATGSEPRPGTHSNGLGARAFMEQTISTGQSAIMVRVALRIGEGLTPPSI